MIKTVIKRDGSKEEFSAEKLNGWGEWASAKLGKEVNWPEAVLHVYRTMSEECSSEDLQNALIKFCLDKNTWEYNKMAGRLYSALIDKKFYDGIKPTVKNLHEELYKDGMMVRLKYSDEEYAEVEKIINHKLDLNTTHYELHQLRMKYALRNKSNGKEYESQQFVYMRMAMALAENEKSDRMLHLRKWYDHLSHKRINAPTPNYVNLGTKLNGYASCCLYTTDDTAPSLAAGDHIAYMMTVMSAGIGTHIKTRSLGDPVRSGLIQHQGKMPYYRSMVGAINANLQNGRGGASTVYYTAYDPEVEIISKAKNPMTPTSKQIRGCDFNFGSNKFFARKVAKNEDVGLVSYYNSPEVYEAQYSKDESEFERLYNVAVEDGRINQFVSARDMLVGVMSEGYETGRHYLHFTDTLNKHTPFKDKIYSSNLCAEIALPTVSFKSVKDLYEPYDEETGSEIGLCSLGGIVVGNIDNDEQYAEVAYYALKMIDVCIHKSDYVFKNLEETAKARLSAGVGIIGLAHLMAKKNLKYSTQEGRDFIHTLNETHFWHLLNASLRLGKELGNAPWMHKTLWPEGWLPIDTYEKKVDDLVTVGYKRDWESLRQEIKDNGGIRNSVLVAHMPAESSAIASGTTNGLYPIRDFDLMKTNDTMVLHYVSPDSSRLRNKYEISWNIDTIDLIKVYAICQKWTDQAISVDLYRKLQGDEKVGSKEMIDIYLNMVKYGLKSRYYVNSLTAKGISEEYSNDEIIYEDDNGVCESCTL